MVDIDAILYDLVGTEVPGGPKTMRKITKCANGTIKALPLGELSPKGD